jgi:hypothetical protein
MKGDIIRIIICLILFLGALFSLVHICQGTEDNYQKELGKWKRLRYANNVGTKPQTGSISLHKYSEIECVLSKIKDN